MSAGIRSGVNWMRFQSRPSTMPSVSTSLVLARPGTPISRPWPPASKRDQGLLDHVVLAEDRRGHASRTLPRVAAVRSTWAAALGALSAVRSLYLA